MTIDIYSVVQKLVGSVTPVGDSSIDHKRFENLKTLTGLVDQLVRDIDAVSTGSTAHQHSIKKAAEFAGDFLTKQLGIEE